MFTVWNRWRSWIISAVPAVDIVYLPVNASGFNFHLFNDSFIMDRVLDKKIPGHFHLYVRRGGWISILARSHKETLNMEWKKSLSCDLWRENGKKRGIKWKIRRGNFEWQFITIWVQISRVLEDKDSCGQFTLGDVDFYGFTALRDWLRADRKTFHVHTRKILNHIRVEIKRHQCPLHLIKFSIKIPPQERKTN